jgi:hypothetical protein
LSSALHIILENKIPNLDEFVNGKCLSKELKTLEKLANELGVKPLMSFYSTNGDDVRSVLGDESPEELGIKIPPEQWFKAEDGLQTIHALLNHFEKSKSPSSKKLVSDLREFDRVLSAAQQHQVHWHLAVDF